MKIFSWLNPGLSAKELQMRKVLLETIERANAESDPAIANKWWDMAQKEKHLIDLLENGSENFLIIESGISHISLHKGLENPMTKTHPTPPEKSKKIREQNPDSLYARSYSEKKPLNG